MVLVSMFSTLLLLSNEEAKTSVVHRFSKILPRFSTNQALQLKLCCTAGYLEVKKSLPYMSYSFLSILCYLGRPNSAN